MLHQKNWKQLLSKRAAADMSYPEELDQTVRKLEKTARLERQHFTDNSAIAKSYARKVGGLLVEIDVSLPEILKYFRLEFQNFSKRKRNFEIVYVVDSKVMAHNRRRWKFTAKRIP